MKTKLFLIFTITIGIFASCKNSSNKNNPNKQSIDYSNKTILDSLIKTTPYSNDTVFLGFTIGMTKSQYKNHIHKLRNEGKTITYSHSNRISLLGNSIEVGPGYTFRTKISIEESDETLTGLGKYFLEPIYDNNDRLMQLNILSMEEWNEGYVGLYEPSWFENRVRENSVKFNNKSLKKALIDYNMINENDFIRQKDSLVIFGSTVTSYVDRKFLLEELLNKIAERKSIKNKNEDVKF